MGEMLAGGGIPGLGCFIGCFIGCFMGCFGGGERLFPFLTGGGRLDCLLGGGMLAG